MGKYLKKFENHSDYETYINGQDAILPNVSHCKDQNDVHYNPITPPETRLIVKFNTTSANESIMILSDWDLTDRFATKVEVDDGTIYENLEHDYNGLYHEFETSGEHIVYYTLKDVNKIPDYMFGGCSEITEVIMSNTITKIGYSAFEECTSLSVITIPENVTSIDAGAFTKCTSLPVENNIRYADTYAIETTNKSLQTYTIKQGTRFVGNGAFKYCSNLTSVTIPDSVTSIGESAFYYCEKLENVNIPSGVTSIEYEAFYRCNGLTSIDIPNGATSIECEAFYGCTNLTAITIPSTIIAIDKDAFSYTPWWAFYSADTNNIYNDVIYINNVAYKATSQYAYSNLVLREGTIGIGGDAFNGKLSLTSITIPNTVTNIGQEAFYYCTNAVSVVIPDSVTSIKRGCFNSCHSLTSVSIGSEITFIPLETFAYCRSLSSITIPSTVTEMGNQIFYGCSALTSIISLATTAPMIYDNTFWTIPQNGTLYVPTGSDYSSWMSSSNYYLGYYGWTKVEQ